MSVRRVFVTVLGVVVIIGLLAWLVMAWLARPGELPLAPLVVLGIAALVGLVTRLASPPSRRPAEPAYRGPDVPDEVPEWLIDAQSPPDEPKPTLDVSPPRLEEPDALAPDALTRPADRDIPRMAEPEPDAEPEPQREQETSAGPDTAEEADDRSEDVEKWFAEGPSVEVAAPEDADDYAFDLDDWFAPKQDVSPGTGAEPEVETGAEPEPETAPEPQPQLREDEPDPEPQAAAVEDDLPPADAPFEKSAPIQFSAYYPREVKPDDWQPLKAYIYKEPAYQTVLADARARLGARDDIRETVAAALQPVAEGALVTAIPSVPGLEFDPPQASARFRRDWRRFDFEFQAVDAPLDEGADGQITFFVEGVIVADVKLSVYVSRRAGRRLKPPQESTARPYQAVFCSYSHKDSVIVARVERSSRMHFTKFLRDVTTLRSGERWNDRLLELIDEADVFQLFWSKPAAESKYVAQEWQYALALRETGKKNRYFIRPVRWEEPMPIPPPPELADLHFDLIRELVED